MLMAILPMFLISCNQMTDEQLRKDKVQSLVKQLADESPEKRELGYADLRDVYVRKRDVTSIDKEIAQRPNSEAAVYLRKLTAYMEQRWRMPAKGWTNNRNDLLSPYFENAKSLETDIFVADNTTPQIEPVILMEVYFPNRAERSFEVVKLILTLEPEALSLRGGWEDISFLKLLTNLQELSLKDSKVDNLKPLKRLPDLTVLRLKNTNVKDLTPLKEVPNLRLLFLDGAKGIDLTSLKDTPIKVIIEK